MRQWHLIDGTMDNLAAVERVGGDVAAADRAMAIREKGWQVLREHPRAGLGAVGWPPVDDPFVVQLSPDDWAFVRAAFERSIRLSREVMTDSRINEAARAAIPEQVSCDEWMLSVLDRGDGDVPE